MKICWDNLEGFYLTRKGYLKKKYKERDLCPNPSKTLRLMKDKGKVTKA